MIMSPNNHLKWAKMAFTAKHFSQLIKELYHLHVITVTFVSTKLELGIFVTIMLPSNRLIAA